MEDILKKVGYYKYYPTNPMIVDCVREYPINDGILNYIRKTGIYKLEYENSKPKLIKGKLVVLI